MTVRRDQVLGLLAADDVFDDFDAGGAPLDLSGWGSSHPYLAAAVLDNEHPIIVDVGVWKGGSTITFAQTLANNDSTGVVVSVDTFLGSAEHHLNPEWRAALRFEHMYPRLYRTFLTDVVAMALQQYVVPLALDSRNAALLLMQCGIAPDVVHIDASHDHESVRQDLDHWYQAVRPGGTIICDDYVAGFPGVIRAVDIFREMHGVESFATTEGKCRFRKPQVDGDVITIDEAERERQMLSEQLQRAQDDATQLAARLSASERRIADLEASTSWRATAWLRALDLGRARRR